MPAKVLITLFFAFTASAVLAQPKPALVQDRDEPGRSPWQQQVTGGCTGEILCSIVLPAVPAGTRLVVTTVTASFTTSGAGGAPVDCILHGGGGFQLNFEIVGTASTRAFMQAVTRYYEAGETPTVLCAATTGTFASPGRAGIAGYLVAVP